VKEIILDVDTGIDDALALVLATHLTDSFQILGVTTVAGNVDLAAATENTRAVLGLVGRADVPVARGARAPLIRPLRTAPAFHGPKGLGEIDLRSWDSPRSPLLDVSAAEFIATTARKRTGRLILIATGPLTNLALAFKMDPSLASHLAELVIMGGAIDVPGNASPVAEANFFTDPEAAQIVLSSGVPIVLVPLDVTEQVTVTRDSFEALRARAKQFPSRVADFACDVLSFYLSACETYGRSGAALHDPLAVAVAARPDLAEWEPLAVQVATSDPLTAGQCIVDRRPRSSVRPEPLPNVRSCRRVRADACREVILESFIASPGGFRDRSS
jgi:purine nucleosidase